MLDMSAFVIAKSDQLNSDDLMGGPRTIKIVRTTGTGSPDQPVAIHYEGDGGRPWKPCKTMRRVLMGAWSKYTEEYVGRSATLYRDAKVEFGGLAVGGIRISHMSHIENDLTLVLNEKKGRKAPYKVKVLREEAPAAEPPARSKADQRADQIAALFEGCSDLSAVEAAATKAQASLDALGQLPDQGPFNRAVAARNAAYQRHTPKPAASDPLDDDGLGDAFEPGSAG